LSTDNISERELPVNVSAIGSPHRREDYFSRSPARASLARETPFERVPDVENALLLCCYFAASPVTVNLMSLEL
jgi:uncharacterized protein YlxW (UPF0749 family)